MKRVKLWRILMFVLLLPVMLFTGVGADGGADGESKDDGEDKDSKDDKSKGEEKTFTQAEVTAMMAKEKNQGKRSAFAELGFKDEKEAKANMTEYQKYLESKKTDDQKKAEANAAADTAKVEAEARALRAEAKVEAMVLGAKPECVEDVIVLSLSKMKDGGEFKTVISEIKAKYPNLFSDGSAGETDKEKAAREKADKAKKAGQKGTGGSVGSGKGTDDKELSLGARLAAQRKGTVTKGSYFKK